MRKADVTKILGGTAAAVVLALTVFNPGAVQAIDVSSVPLGSTYWDPIGSLVKMYSSRDDFYPKPKLHWVGDSTVLAEFDMAQPMFDPSIDIMHVESTIVKVGDEWKLLSANRRWTCLNRLFDHWTTRPCS